MARPGPWRWNLRQTNGEIWDGPDQGRMVAQVFGHGCKEVADANGHLLAAAPEMLEVLKSVERHELDPALRDAARRVVAKAEGRIP